MYFKNQIFLWGLRNLNKSNLCSLDLTRPRLVCVLLYCKLRPTGFTIGHPSLKKYSVIYSGHIKYFTHRELGVALQEILFKNLEWPVLEYCGQLIESRMTESSLCINLTRLLLFYADCR